MFVVVLFNMSNIGFFYHTAFVLANEAALQKWLRAVAAAEKKELFQVEYNFVDEKKITKLNQAHLGHNYPTDVLTFDYSSGNQIHAEVFVCEQVVKSNAAELNEPFLKELHRVVLHGLLHLLGHNDKTPEERKNIRSLEDKYLKEL